MSGWIEILNPGPLSTIQDLGRPGHSSSGVPESGALDSAALRLANRLVGNDEDCAGIEVTFGGLHLRAHGAAIVAVTGAVVDLRDDHRPVSSHCAIRLSDGATLRLGVPTAGMRSYFAIRGGLEGSRVYGSLSTDMLSGFGAQLVAGQRLPVGPAPRRQVPAVDVVPFTGLDPDEVVVRVVLGPRHSWFTPSAVHRMTSAHWQVDGRSNRVGLRLIGPALTRTVRDELPSEGVVRGAVQVPTNGQPIVFLNDHPVTGGYPVIAVVVHDDLDLLAQCRAGQSVRFSAVEPPAVLGGHEAVEHPRPAHPTRLEHQRHDRH